MTFTTADLEVIGKSMARETHRLQLLNAKKELSVKEFALLSGRSINTVYKALSVGSLRYIAGTKKIKRSNLLLF